MNVLSTVLAADGGGNALSYLFLPLIFIAMYFLMIRPQRRRQKEAAALQRGVEVGDEIMTTSGVYGFVTGFDGDIAWLEIDDNVQIRIARAAIQRRVDTAMTDVDDAASPEAKPRHGLRTSIAPAEGSSIDSGDEESSK